MTTDSLAIKQLAEGWRNSGVEPGDTVLVHSSISRTMARLRQNGVDASPDHIIESFLTALTDDGTLLLPLFNYDFPKSKFFDIRNTPSQVGVMSEFGRLDPRAVRTGHPIYSFAVIGKKAALFSGCDNNSGYALDSPFGLLRTLSGKIAVLDVADPDCMTFYHHVEEMLEVPYRYFKTFSGTCIDHDGVDLKKTYQLYVRNLEQKVITHVSPAGELLWRAGLYKGFRSGIGNGLRTIDANKMFDFVANIITDNRALGTLYRIDGSS